MSHIDASQTDTHTHSFTSEESISRFVEATWLFYNENQAIHHWGSTLSSALVINSGHKGIYFYSTDIFGTEMLCNLAQLEMHGFRKHKLNEFSIFNFTNMKLLSNVLPFRNKEESVNVLKFIN